MRHTKKITTKVLRTRHEVTLWSNGKAGDLHKIMGDIPNDARMVDVDEDAEGHTVLVFEREQPEEG